MLIGQQSLKKFFGLIALLMKIFPSIRRAGYRALCLHCKVNTHARANRQQVQQVPSATGSFRTAAFDGSNWICGKTEFSDNDDAGETKG